MYCRAAGAPPELAESNALNRTQASTVRVDYLRLGESSSLTEPFVPSNPKADPTKPTALALAPPCRTPLLVPPMSCAVPSPGHQPASPAGADTQAAGVTNSPARLLVTEPAMFVTTTE